MSRTARITLLIALIAASLLTIANGYRLNSKLIDSPPFPAAAADPPTHQQRLVGADTVPVNRGYVKASIPMRVFSCMQEASILRCLKLFLLQRMDRTDVYANSGNLTADFLDQMLRNDGDDLNEVPLLDGFGTVSDADLDERLLQCLRRFFRHREIKLYFLPGMVVKVVPSVTNFLHLSVRKAKSMTDVGTARNNKDLEIAEDDVKGGGIGGGDGGIGGLGGGQKNKHKTTEYLLQLGVPALMMPAILLGSVLPFLLPALKMATIMSTLINNGALLTAAMYVAKQAAFSNEKVYYSSPGYHRDFSNF